MVERELNQELVPAIELDGRRARASVAVHGGEGRARRPDNREELRDLHGIGDDHVLFSLVRALHSELFPGILDQLEPVGVLAAARITSASTILPRPDFSIRACSYLPPAGGIVAQAPMATRSTQATRPSISRW
jgi:hypothetical protein